MVVEDNEAERMLISTYLRQQGYRLYQALDGLDGINKARLLVPDLILMDTDMPTCNGYEACKVLTQDAATREVPIIFLSAYAAPTDRVEGLLAGAVDYIAKPFDFDEVRLRLSVHLGRSSEAVASAETAVNKCGDNPQAPTSTQNLDSVLFYSARVHLLRMLNGAPGIDELARRVGTNSKRLNLAFRNYAGMTVFEYLREERMQEAQRLLRHTGQSVSDIAAHVGFSSCANFSTAFRLRFGSSPSACR
ncbi:response regulator [Halomonas piscis]|uniref:Response regulator n=1 Tax=Halomonas piscis TaxID=3031727 RepID=A0ABY9Z054_9GAMM|nr:response regulator [Halomonas piscis]WNK20411.1 response regulator [Halomonas piscis]